MRHPAPTAMYAGPIGPWHLGFALVGVGAAWFLASPLFAASLALGALLEAVNFRTLRRNCEKIFSGMAGTGARSGIAAALGFGLRYSVLLAAVGAAIYAGIHPVGLVIGLSLIVPSTLIAAWATRPKPDETAGPLDPDDPSWETWNPWLARENAAEEDDA